jgi:hypothetical protein
MGSGLVLGALTLGAQQNYPQQYPPRSDYYRYDRDGWRNMMLGRVRADLDNAQSRTIPFSGDRWRIARAKESLSDFQRDLNSGNYDRNRLDSAIVATQRVVDDGHMPYRWQERLRDDVNRLRNLESRLDGGA